MRTLDSTLDFDVSPTDTIRTIREIFFINMIKNSKQNIQVSKIGDFEIDGMIFEIGGKNMDRKQIKENLDRGYIVKDDILHGSKYEIPLYLFGFLY